MQQNNLIIEKIFIRLLEKISKTINESSNDESIISIRDSIKNTNLANGRLLFFGNGASASLCSHAATDFTTGQNNFHLLMTII